MASLAAETTGGEIVVVFWPKHGLRSNLSVSNVPGGHASDPSSLFTLTHMLIRHHNDSKTAGSGPELYTPCFLSFTYLGSFSWLFGILATFINTCYWDLCYHLEMCSHNMV